MKGLQGKVCEEWLESVGLSPRSWRKTSWWSPASYREWRVGMGGEGGAVLSSESLRERHGAVSGEGQWGLGRGSSPEGSGHGHEYKEHWDNALRCRV